MTTPSIPPVQPPPKKSRFWRFVKRVLIGVVLLLVFAALGGAAYQAIASWRDARRFPQEGRSIALGADFPGVSLNLNCVGQGAPTVILDSGWACLLWGGISCSRKSLSSHECVPTIALAMPGAARGRCHARAAKSRGSCTRC